MNGGDGNEDLLDFSDGTSAITFTLNQGTNGGANWSFGASTAGLGTDSYRNCEGVIGTNFADTLTGSLLADTLRGGGGNDTINGAGGADQIVGGMGADSLAGGSKSDTFVFDSVLDAVDTITNFNTAAPASGGDILGISSLLVCAPTINSGNIALYLSARDNGSGSSILGIDRDGSGASFGFQDFVVLNGITGLSLTSLLTNGNIDTTL